MTVCKSTVVIPNYNGIKFIDACLESLYAGTTQNIEVIVVDNASNDGSLALIKERYPQVHLIENQENTGFCHAVNQGILASKTPYVILLNNDTRAGLSFVHELEKIMDSCKEVFSASAKLISMYDHNKIDDAGDFYCALGWAFARGRGKNPSRYQKDDTIFAACGGAAIYRRALFAPDKVGLFDENHFAYLEDIDIGYRAQLYGYQNRFAANSIVYHAGSAASGSRYNAFKTKLAAKNSVYLIYKNMPVFQILLNLPFLLAGFFIKFLFFLKKGYGKEYLLGLWKGFTLSAGKKGREHKQKFEKSRFSCYMNIQFTLWKNLFRLFLDK